MKAIHQRYQPLYPLEPGPEARVFLLRDLWQPDAQCVLTLLPEGLSALSSKQFEEFYSLRRSLAHPSLAALRDFAWRGRKLGLVTDFIEGKALDGQLPPAELAPSLALRIAELLAHLHGRGFHCGLLLPSQFFCSAEGVLTANILVPHNPQACGPRCQGHIRYASPEHLQKGSSSVRADLYSLGMILYLLFTGFPPFFEDDAQTLHQKQLMADPAPPRKLNADIPEEISQLILSLIHKDPELRPESAQYAVSMLRPLCSPAPLADPPLLTPLLGRDEVLVQFRGSLQDFQQDTRSRLLVVEGVAGIGKSRLLQRFEIIARLHRLPVFRVPSAQAPQVGNPQAVFWDDWKPSAKGRPAIARLLDGQVPRLVVLSLGAEGKGDAWERLTEAVAGRAPVTELRLRPLKRQQARRLLESLLGECPADMESRILDQCSGNPFFLMESLRQMRRTGELRYRDGGWRWNPSALSTRELPSAVVENVQARLGRLPRLAREIAEFLSLFDRPVPLEMLCEILGRPAVQVEDEMRRLDRLDMAQLGGSLAALLASMHHVWMRRAVRASLPRPKLRQMHLQIVRRLEKDLGPHLPSALLEALARHSLRAGDRKRCRKYLWPAVDSLQADSLLAEAARLLDEAWESRLLPQEDWAICSKLIQLLYQCGRLERCIQTCRSLLKDADAVKEPANRFQTLSVLGRAHLLKGETSQAAQALEEALPFLEQAEALDADNEVRSELLACLTLQGELSRAAPLALRLESEARRRQSPSFEKVCHSLSLYSQQLLDRPENAIGWEVRAIRLAYQHNRPQRSAGRLLNLAQLQANLGRLGRAESLIQFVQQDSSLSRHAELQAFSRLAKCVVLGRRGLHRQALKQLHKLNQRPSRSRNIEAGVQIELAYNCNRLLQPESALAAAEECRRLIAAEFRLEDAVDASLAQAESWMLLGQPERAGQILSQLDREEAPVRQLRRHLLKARLLHQSGNLEGALTTVGKANGDSALQRPADQLSALLLSAEIHLAGNRFDDASKRLAAAFRAAQGGRFPARLAEAYRLQARLHLRQGRPRHALTCCKRAIQIAASIEKPVLTARLQHEMGRAWMLLGDNQAALDCMALAVQEFKQRLFHLSPANRPSFSKQWIAPVEQDRARALPEGTPAVPRYLTQLRQFASQLDSAPDARQLGERLLESIGECISSSGNVFLQSSGSQSFQLAASRGRCLRTGRHLLAWSESAGAVLAGKIFSHSNGAFTEIGIRLTLDGRLQGLVYLERPGAAPSEEELDFLACLAASVELSLRSLAPPAGPSANGAGPQSELGFPLVAEDPLTLRLLDEVSRIAPSGATVLISGESGTGKELVARAIHQMSARSSGPFVAVNCSGLTGSLIETELFGHSKGSFTGAGRDRRGLFEAADQGTLFLDEIASMPAEVQRSLLRALENRSVRRVGETRERSVDVRILSATNQPLAKLVEQGDFRRDLYHRLKVCELHVPPLRSRRDDIVPLCRHFLERLQLEGQRRVQLSDGALSLLEGMDFPGNVRELRNLLESAYYLCSGNRIRAADLAARLDPSQPGASGESTAASRILEGMVSGRLDFWKDVRGPFLNRDLSRREVREVISLGLSQCDGNYRRLTEHIRLPAGQYKRLMGFLAHHNLKVDYRKYRRRRGEFHAKTQRRKGRKKR